MDFSDTAAEAAKLALKMGTAATDAILFMADLGEELPVLEPVLGTIKAIREKVDTVKRNKEELAALEERCTYISACVIAKHRRTPTSEMDVTALQDSVDAVNEFVERCGGSSWRVRFRRVFKASDEKDEIDGLNARIDRLTGDLQLAGIATMEGKIDLLKAAVEKLLSNDKRPPRQQESFRRRQGSSKRWQEAFGKRLTQTPARIAKVPKGTPASKSWHVDRRQVMETVFEALTEDGGPRLVGLVGDSGSGKTTAASTIVRSAQLREAFQDGIVWLPINEGANRRLPSMRMQLAHMVYEGIGGSVGRPPAKSDDGAAYIKQRMEKGHVGKGLKCLVVADNVWEEEVVLELLKTGMWVLLTTRNEELVKGAQGEAVGVDELSMRDAKSVLTHAAELDAEEDLPDDAVTIIDLCGRVAMDLAFVGRWSTVRKRQYRHAWRDAADTIRTEIDKVLAEPDSGGVEGHHAKRRKAILHAGFEDLAVGSDDTRVPRLYLSLAVMPDGHAFTVEDAAELLCNLAPSAEDVKSAEKVVETLERWAVVRFTEGAYHMHDAHTNYARERLMDRGDVRRPAVERWVRRISSLDALRSIDAFVLKELWLGVDRMQVDPDCCYEPRPYLAALDEMDESDPLLRQSLDAMTSFQEEQEDWDAASKTGRRQLEVEKRMFGPDHIYVLVSLEALAHCADRLGHHEEAEEWRTNHREAIPLALARMRSNLGAGGLGTVDGADGLHYLGVNISSWAPGCQGEVEKLLRTDLVTKEEHLGQDDLRMSETLYSLGVCVRDAGRLEEAEELLRRCLVIEEANLGREDVEVAETLFKLGVCVRDAGRLDEAAKLLRRCLVIKEAKLGRGDMQVSPTLYELGVCVRNAGRLEEGEDLLRQCLVIEEDTLGRDDVQVAGTLYELALCVLDAGRLDEAEKLFRRCLVITEARLGREDLQVAATLYKLGVCIQDAGRLEEAEDLFGRCLGIQQAKLGRESVMVAYTLHCIGVCVRGAGRLEEAEDILKRCLAIKEDKLGGDVLEVTYTLHELDMCVKKQGRLQEAEEILRRCLVIEEANLGREDLRVADTLHCIGVCVRDAGRLQEAEELFRRCLGITKAKLGGPDLAGAITLHALGKCVRDAGRLEEAEELLCRCLAIQEAQLGREDVEVSITLHELGVCVRDAGRLEDAEKLLRRCLVIKETELGPEDLGVSVTLYELSVCVEKAGRPEEAEQLLRRRLETNEAKER